VKIPGIGEVKPVYAVGGGALVLGVVGYAYYKNKKSQAAAASAAVSSTAAGDGTLAGTGAGDSGIDPSTGLPYADESDDGADTYGGIDPATGVPYYDEITQSSTTTNPNAITTNEQWIETAEQDAENLFGATPAVAESAVEAYMSQTTAGLPTNAYTLMQSIVGELGQPPVGGPYRLIQAGGGTSTTGGGTTTLANSVGKQISLNSNIGSFGSLSKLAAHFHEGLPEIQNANPGVAANATTGVVKVPVLITKTTTPQSLATLFMESVENIEQQLESQGIV
jgi:hypothetical protein